MGRSPFLQILKTKLLFGIQTITARKGITRNWLQSDAPAIESWYDIIYEIFVMEKEKWKMDISPKRPFFCLKKREKEW